MVMQIKLVVGDIACVQTSPPPSGKKSGFFPEEGQDVCTQASMIRRIYSSIYLSNTCLLWRQLANSWTLIFFLFLRLMNFFIIIFQMSLNLFVKHTLLSCWCMIEQVDNWLMLHRLISRGSHITQFYHLLKSATFSNLPRHLTRSFPIN